MCQNKNIIKFKCLKYIKYDIIYYIPIDYYKSGIRIRQMLILYNSNSNNIKTIEY